MSHVKFESRARRGGRLNFHCLCDCYLSAERQRGIFAACVPFSLQHPLFIRTRSPFSTFAPPRYLSTREFPTLEQKRDQIFSHRERSFFFFFSLSPPPLLKLHFRPNVREEVHLLTKYARENPKSRRTGTSNFYENRTVQFRTVLLAFSLLRCLTTVSANCIH